MRAIRQLLLGCLSLATFTAAAEMSGAWTGPYTDLKVLPTSSITSAAVAAPAASVNKYIQSARLVQHIPLKTIIMARLMIAIQLESNPVVLPDGSNLEPLGAPSQGVDLFRITYNSTDVTGQHTLLSGLVAIPVADDVGSGGDASGGIVVYMHATTAQRSNAPGDREREAYGVVTAFGGENYVLALPDYLGYGANHKPHPYALSKLNAPAGRDMILAVRELMASHARSVGPSLFISGYSEGGGNAFGLARLLQESGDASLQPTAIAPMSGPYDLSGATAQSFIGKQPPLTIAENVMGKPMLLGFAGVATSQLTFQPSVSLLKPAFAAQTRKLFPGSKSDTTVAARLLTTAISDYNYISLSGPNPEDLLQKTLVDAITTHDTNFPAMKLWSENDSLDWQPNAPVYLLGVIQDPLVVFAGSDFKLPAPYVTANGVAAPFTQGNAQNVIKRMRANNLGPDRVGWMGFNGTIEVTDQEDNKTQKSIMGHLDGFVPCAILAAKFFKARSLSGMPVLADP